MNVILLLSVRRIKASSEKEFEYFIFISKGAKTYPSSVYSSASNCKQYLDI